MIIPWTVPVPDEAEDRTSDTSIIMLTTNHLATHIFCIPIEIPYISFLHS